MNKITFWVTNISNMNVSLSDLNLTIKPFSSVNLLDSKHYSYTKEQLDKSVKDGSIFKKRNKIFVRKVAPIVEVKTILSIKDTYIQSRERSVYSIKQETYEELEMTDDEFIKENIDLIDSETSILPKRKQ
tara:strand:+ start:244 stop:633 length:390 start_codon:yes stop_codon:yes gene_type:complete